MDGLLGYSLAKSYTDKIVGALPKGLNYKGTKSTVSDLPLSGNTKGDLWSVSADGSEWIWTISSASGAATDWLELGKPLPTVVNNRYLHTNATTGALEWSEVSGGSDKFYFITDTETNNFQEVAQACASGLAPVIADSGAFITCSYPNYEFNEETQLYEGVFKFTMLYYDTSYSAFFHYDLILNSETGWGWEAKLIEDAQNKIVSWTGLEDNDEVKYPSASLVKESLDTKQAAAFNLVEYDEGNFFTLCEQIETTGLYPKVLGTDGLTYDLAYIEREYDEEAEDWVGEAKFSVIAIDSSNNYVIKGLMCSDVGSWEELPSKTL